MQIQSVSLSLLSDLLEEGPQEPGGKLVIGNFSDENPNRAFMEGGMNWFLHHRSPEQLIDLAKQAGAAS